MARFTESRLTSSGNSGPVAPHVPDSSFEPHSNFSFDDGDDEFHDMHHQISSLDMFNPDTNAQNDLGVGIRNRMVDGEPHEVEPGSIKLYHFDQQPTSTGNPWSGQQPPRTLAPHSMQADIATKRSDSVDHHFGQLTPPDDALLPTDVVSPAQQQLNTRTSLQAPSNAKSERARNAANHRHGKTKKSKQENRVDVSSPQSDGVSSEDKREKYREKNRLAAAKCRAKKKNNVEDLEEKARQVTSRNSQLKLQVRELRDAFSELRNEALMHDASQGCGCGQIHMYNANKAQQTARGATTLPAFLNVSIHGQDQFGSIMGPSLAGHERLGRTQSMSISNDRPHMHLHPRSYSTIDQTAFLPDSVDMMQLDSNDLSDLSFEEE